MSRTRIIQNSLTTGTISPTLQGRIDLDKYYNAVEVAENVTIMPHGGMERRPGLRAMTQGWLTSFSRLFSFEFSETQNYIIMYSNSQIRIYKPNDKTLYASLNWSFSLTDEQVKEIDVIQSADTVIFTHEDIYPQRLQRQGTDTSWVLENIPLSNIPKFDFDESKIPTYFNYGESIVFDIKRNEIVYNNDKNNINGADQFLYKAIVDRDNTDLSTEDFSDATYWENLGKRSNVWGQTLISFTYESTGVVGTIAFNQGDIVYNNDGNSVNGTSGNYYMSRTDRLGPDAVNPSTEDYSDFTKWDNLGSQILTDRGYPRTCTFHQGRLWFGGSREKPTSVWGSVSNNFFNFDIGGSDVQPDDAIFDVLDTDQYNVINNIISGTKLQVLTAGGEFVNNEDIITPSSSSWTRFTGYGSKRLRPVSLDGSTYFVDRFGKTVRGLIYDFEEGGYTTPPISILSEHIIEDVSRMDILRGSSSSVSNLLYLVNGDGSVAVLNTMRKENINGWTKWTTNQGKFIDVTVTGDTVSFIVERPDSGSLYLETLDNRLLLDHCFDATESNKVLVDGFLDFPTSEDFIRVVADDVVQQSQSIVNESGSYYAYADRTSSFLYAGLNYDVKIKTLPVSFNTQSEGNIRHLKKRITRCILQLYNSRGVYVNDILVTNRKFGDNLDEVFELITGTESVYLLGYNNKGQVEIKQINPDPMTLLSIDLEVSY